MSWEDEAVVEDIAAAGRFLSDTINRDLRCYAAGDLLDAIDAARYASHPYATPPKEWPPYIDVSKKRELPPQVVDCYNAGGGQGMALCGIFPTLRRAWATVDETLFIWRFDKWDGTCVEYSGEEQAICAVGLAKAKPGVFVEAIQHILVLATPVELVLLGVCCGANSDGSDSFSELSLQPLPEYTVPTDGVTMTCIAATETGRIFLGGRDGHIYELLYSTGTGWQSRCRKVCHTGGFGSVISRWIIPNALKFGAADAILELAVDDERHVLYARTQESKVQLFDLGRSGNVAPRKVGEEKNFGDHRDARQVGPRSGASRSGSRTKAAVVSLAPLSSVESKWLHLVAVVSDGRRVYMSTTPAMGGSQVSSGTCIERPSLLRVVSTRPGPSVGVGGGISLAGVIGSRPQGDGLKIQGAHYSSGNFVLADASPSSRLLVARKDYTSPIVSSGSSYGAAGTSGRNLRALREVVSTLGVEGQIYAISDVLPPPGQAEIAEALVWDSRVLGSGGLGEVSRARALWALGDLATQHILPRRRAVVVSTLGLMEVVMNRPVDLLQRLFETNTSRGTLEEFFLRFGAGEAAAMCLLLASRIVAYDDKVISMSVAEKAAEAFEDPRLVGVPQMQGGAVSTTSAVTTGGAFNMGQVVHEAEPVFSGAHEGLCLCSSRLLWSVWELPVFVAKGASGNDMVTDVGRIIVCRISPDAMGTLEDKIRSLEMFLRARRNQRRGQYGRIMGIGDLSGYGDRNGITRSEAGHKLQYDTAFAKAGGVVQGQGPVGKRQRVAFTPAELTAMEVRGMECVRRLLRRAAEALLLLQLLSQHHLTRLVQSLEPEIRRQLLQVTFHQIVCSQEGEYVATRLIGALMEYYVSPEGRGTVDDISVKLRDGCPSYYNEADDKFYQSVQCLEKATNARDVEVREHLAREALDLLAKVPETANLLSVCQRFEEIRFYEAVVELPLRKARALDPNEDAFNEHIDEHRRKMALAARQQCYEVITNALRALVPQTVANGNGSKAGPPDRHLDPATRMRYVRQIVQLSVRSPDRAFHEYLYDTMIELGLEKELLELAGPDLVPFLQAAGDFQSSKPAKSPRGLPSPPSVIHMMKPISSHQAKYLELLSRYYVYKRQHSLAAYVLLRLAERKQPEGGEQLTLDARHEYLSNAVVQARSTRHGTLGSTSEVGESGLLELLEGKLAVLRFQLKIQAELDSIASQMETEGSSAFPPHNFGDDAAFIRAARERALELGAELKSITQLYNNYAVPFEFWEVCLEILHFSHYTSDGENNVMRETWARLIDQAIRIKGIAEACSVIKRVGPQLYPGDGSSVPLDSICLHLERAAEERVTSGLEIVGDEDVPRALLAACHESPEPVQRTYDQLLTSASVLPATPLRLRMLRSVLAVMREWTILVVAQRIGSIGGDFLSADDSAGVRDRLCSTLNRYMTEVKRLPISPAVVEPVARGFKELEEMLLGSQSLQLH